MSTALIFLNPAYLKWLQFYVDQDMNERRGRKKWRPAKTKDPNK